MRKLQAELPALRAQAATVADLTAQAAALRQRSATPAGAMPAKAELAASLARAGLPASQWTLGESDSGGGVELSLEQAPSSALLRWLDGAGRDWSLAISHVDLTRAANANGRPLPGLVNGKVVLMPPQTAGGR
ncbi:General secretion pathway, M protein [compost metagenome]